MSNQSDASASGWRQLFLPPADLIVADQASFDTVGNTKTTMKVRHAELKDSFIRGSSIQCAEPADYQRAKR
jgi:hypothetical protein